jgi:hypothetical protein
MAALIWIGLSLCAGYFGKYRRLGSVGWFCLSLVISPFLALLILFITAPKGAVVIDDGHTRNP